MRERLLTVGIAAAIIAIVGLLTFAHFSNFDGYSYTYCNTFSLINTAEAHGTEDSSPDQKRINDLNTLAHHLEMYKEQNGAYPVYTKATTIHAVRELETSTFLDPCFMRNKTYSYHYISNMTGSQYVIRALLSDSGYRYIHAQHDEDIEGTQLGLWCGEGLHKRAFCLSSESSMDHDHHNIQETLLPITLSLSTTTNSREITINTTNFLFSEDSVDTSHVDGMGHAHLFINGEKVQRVFSDTINLPDLQKGTHIVSVSLNTNDHATYVKDGLPIQSDIAVEIH